MPERKHSFFRRCSLKCRVASIAKKLSKREGLPQMFCVVHIEVPQLVKETARRTEKEEGRLDVEHRVEVLKQQLLPILHVTC